mmetsp:Transcript_6969/g.12720  ORF Transcript_6969/g.12720 Transcript_6969/m.12720 type:complete len:268 (+) Transcript_6969:395-1198(+)
MLIIAFKNSYICSQWGVKLQECISRRVSTGLKTNSLGNVFDITEIEGAGYWRDFKVTFVRGSWSCEEFMLFDSSQNDLQRSADEVLSALEGRLDEANRKVMEEYINQLAEVETSRRRSKIALPSLGEYSRQANTRLLSLYKDLSFDSCEQKVHAHYTAHITGSLPLLSEAFNLIYLQKEAQNLTINRIAVARAARPEISKIRKRLGVSSSSRLSQREQYELNKTAAHIARVKENSKISDDPEVKNGSKDPRACGGKFFGEACDCSIF